MFYSHCVHVDIDLAYWAMGVGLMGEGSDYINLKYRAHWKALKVAACHFPWSIYAKELNQNETSRCPQYLAKYIYPLAYQSKITTTF